MSHLLTKEDVYELTGYKRPEDQMRRLRAMTIPFFDLCESEYPRLTWRAVNDTLTAPQHTEPNLKALDAPDT